MLLFHKDWALHKALLSGVGLLALALAGPALASEGKILKRTPLCTEAISTCSVLFYLNSTDKVQVLRPSTDGKWLYIEYGPGQQKGWVHAEDLKLLSPQGMTYTTVQSFEQSALGLSLAPDFFGVLYPESLNRPQSDPLTFRLPLEAVPFSLLTDQSGQSLTVYYLSETEKRWFLTAVQPLTPPYPHFQTLLRFQKPDDFLGMAKIPAGLLVLGESEGAWGQSLVTGLDPEGIPFLLIQKPEEFVAYLPQEIRAVIRPENLRPVSLSPEGDLVFSTFHLALRRFVLLRFSYREGWLFHSLLLWPKDLSFRPDLPGLKMRLVTDAEQSYLFFQPPDQTAGFLGFYSGATQEPTILQALQKPVLDAVIYQKKLWTLHLDELRVWNPVFATEAAPTPAK